MLANRVYFMNDPKRLKSNGDCCEGGVLPGVNWPDNPDYNLPGSGFGLTIEDIGDFLIQNPNEIVTLFLDGNASYAAFLKEFESQFGIDSTYLKLFMNQADYGQSFKIEPLGEIRSRGNRRLAVFHTGGTFNFNGEGYSVVIPATGFQ